MDQVRRLLKDLSLRKSIILYISVFAVLAILLSSATASLCAYAGNQISESYPVIGEKYYLTNQKGERLGEGSYIYRQKTPFSKRDEFLTSLLDFLPLAAAPVYSALCILTAALLFYRNKLKEPLARLRAASEKIADNDLDFSVRYDSRDELGQLCSSFESMRAALDRNLSDMWRQVEERRRLNAAFAHDLRTPLTVLKGYDELLQQSEDPRTRETALTMGRHLARMESYVDSMSRLRRLEDSRPEYKAVSLAPFLASLQESAEIVCAQNKKTLRVHNNVTVQQLSIDSSFVSQVCSNLIANAVRYAASAVTLSLSAPDGGLLLTVSDDGKGFSPDCLRRAAEPYFTQESDRFGHFGLGLFICRLLCEHHGGFLELGNGAAGAKVSAFFRSPLP